MKNLSLILTLVVLVTATLVRAEDIYIENPVKNPATEYCKSLGYEWFVEKTEEGERGMCKFPDNSTASEWSFLRGNVSQEWSYCKKKGYEIKTLFNDTRCSSIYSADCAVCVLANGTEIEVTKLMKSTEPKTGMCGNSICENGENYNTCPEDCPKTETENAGNLSTIIYIIAFLTIIIILALYILRSRTKIEGEYYFKR